jgi:hypothetical protein
LKFVEKAEVVAFVLRSPGFGREVEVVCVASGANAWISIEGVDLETGVVGEDERAGRVERIIRGLITSIALEVRMIFRRRGYVGEAGKRLNVDAAIAGGGEVAELSGVGGGDVKLHPSIGIPFWRIIL